MSDLKKPSNCVGKSNAIVGRPPTDLIKLAEELIEWSYTPQALNLIGFSSPRKFTVTRLADYAVKDEAFSDALRLAKENISLNRFNASCAKLMPEVYYNRCEAMYDPLYNAFSKEEKRYESELRKKEESSKQSTYNIMVPHDLAIGANISAEAVSKEHPSSAQ